MTYLILLIALVTRFFLSPLFYFLIAVGLCILFIVYRRNVSYNMLKLAPVLFVAAETIAIFMGMGSGGYIFGTVVCIITLLLGMGEERKKQLFIEEIGYNDRETRKNVRTLQYTFGEVKYVEKVKMSESQVLLTDEIMYFSVNIPKNKDRVIIEVPYVDIRDIYIKETVTTNKLYLPRMRDLFIPIRNVRNIGKPEIRDYFMIVKTSDNLYTFYEEAAVILKFQEKLQELAS
ncbi:MAG: hypothetical protein FXF54_11015 [Kosmotoga sp.]|nr:MAG: hypothetical protein FXF54_11015 [Kosmotoga sp.]